MTTFHLVTDSEENCQLLEMIYVFETPVSQMSYLKTISGNLHSFEELVVCSQEQSNDRANRH